VPSLKIGSATGTGNWVRAAEVGLPRFAASQIDRTAFIKQKTEQKKMRGKKGKIKVDLGNLWPSLSVLITPFLPPILLQQSSSHNSSRDLHLRFLAYFFSIAVAPLLH